MAHDDEGPVVLSADSDPRALRSVRSAAGEEKREADAAGLVIADTLVQLVEAGRRAEGLDAGPGAGGSALELRTQTGGEILIERGVFG